MHPRETMPDVSVVIPVFNEKENLDELQRRLGDVLERLGRPAEILFIDDASTDGSDVIINRLAEADRRVRGVRFSRNFGHQAALTAGMQFARGELVVLMDGDLQDPPELIPEMIAKLDEARLDVVYAVRRRREGGVAMRLLYRVFYRLLQRLSYIRIPLDAGDFCVMRRPVVDAINRLPERGRFLRGLRAWVGYQQAGLEYDRPARHAGEAKYTLGALIRLALDGIVAFSYVPLRLATWAGFFFALTGMLYALWLIVLRLYRGSFIGLSGWVTIVVAVLVLGGLQMMLIGVIGEYIGRIFEETKGRPQYIVERRVGFDAASAAETREDPHG